MPATDTSNIVRPADIARSLVFYPVFYLGSILLVLAGTMTLVLPNSVTVAMAYAWFRWHRWCCRHLLGIRVVVEGELPDHPVLYAVRHESFFEAIDLPNVLPNPMIFAKKELLEIPLWGKLGYRYGLIGVDRSAGARALRGMISEARTRGAGRPLAIFPEGTRVPYRSSPPLQAGFAGLYKVFGLPVVPVAVDSGRLYHRLWKKSGVVRYRVCAELPSGLPRQDIETAVHTAINTLNR
ncbi:lysophospholipid acyltransferase family protein [Novosphingobium nitrogenifigens]|uniref:lysophospholipid acyltransferase family protein n=1 Tax=Novosphingobium nitrogenifigens TaxID=378548 RepID=UPI0002EA33E6|nr:lysophospholipid acyltransferase family protein [Novosphingobium nitrogenifigens]